MNGGLGKNNVSEYLRVGDGAGGRGSAVENIKKAKWRVGGRQGQRDGMG